jgi:hypothetical protein
MTMNNESESVSKEACVLLYQALSRNLPDRTQETHERPQHNHVQGQMRTDRNLSPFERNSEALQLEKTVFWWE